MSTRESSVRSAAHEPTPATRPRIDTGGKESSSAAGGQDGAIAHSLDAPGKGEWTVHFDQRPFSRSPISSRTGTAVAARLRSCPQFTIGHFGGRLHAPQHAEQPTLDPGPAIAGHLLKDPGLPYWDRAAHDPTGGPDQQIIP